MALAVLNLASQARFSPGQVVMTAGVDELVRQGRLNPTPYLRRHLHGDWGDLCDDDWQLNDAALKSGDRVLGEREQRTCENCTKTQTTPGVGLTPVIQEEDETTLQVLQVLQALRSTLGSMVPAIIMTGDTSPQRLRDAQSTSALLLHKPVSTGQLRDAITLLLQQPTAAWPAEENPKAAQP